QFRDAARRPDARDMLAEPTVGGRLDRDLDLVVIDDFQLGDGHAGIVDEDFFGVGESSAVEKKGRFRAALHAARHDASQSWRNSIGLGRAPQSTKTSQSDS